MPGSVSARSGPTTWIIPFLGCIIPVSYTHLDVYKRQLFAQKKNKKYLSTRCFIEQGTVDTLPYTDEMFDVVTAFETVYFWNDLPKAFTEVTRVLKRNGHFLICCELNNPSVKTWTNLIDGMIIRSCDELKSILLQLSLIHI